MKNKDKGLSLPEYCDLLPNGSLIISREFNNITESTPKQSKVPDYLRVVDHSLAINKEDYEKRLAKQEEQLNLFVRKLKAIKKSLIIVFQGRDGAGKSSTTERILEALDYDMSIFQAIHIGPPSEDEGKHPHLWRFLTNERMPTFGQVRVFDRSWTERVLVEPVMGITKGKELFNSYAELRTFEWLLVSQGNILIKFWLDITKKEQLRRFKKRQKKKPWKVSQFDGIARKHWDDYTEYANKMFYLTGTNFAPWHIVSSENKAYSRIAILEIINQTLEKELKHFQKKA